jgi:hypothetical protein
MHRLRITLLTAAIVTTLTAFTLTSLAQPPGGGAQGRGGRGGGPGGFGGFGGFGGGGPGGSLLNLASNPVVQVELKLKEPQKAKVKSLVDSYNERSRAMGDRMRAFFTQINPGGGRGQGGGQGQGGQAQGGQGGGRGRNRNAAQGGQVGGGGGGNGGGGGGGGGQGGQVGGGGGGRGQNGGGGRGGRMPMTEEQQAQMAEMRQATQQLQQSAEQSLAKIIGPAAFNRLRQISYQRQGPFMLLQPEWTEKFNLDEEQVAQLQGLRDEGRQAQRQAGRQRMELMKGAFPTPPGGNGGQNGGGGNNGRGGRGGGMNFQDPAFQDAMKAYMEKPEVQAKLEEFQSQQQKLDSQLMAAVHRVLDKRQSNAYKKLLGAPFDLTKLRPGPGGFGNRNQADDSSKAKSKSDVDDDEDSPKSSTGAKAANSAATAKPKRKSLRELRGIDD